MKLYAEKPVQGRFSPPDRKLCLQPFPLFFRRIRSRNALRFVNSNPILKMRLLTSILLVSLSVSSYSFSLQGQQSKTCEITESDGSPTLEEAAQDSSCDIILIGPSTTVNVTTSLNMTGIENKHIVCRLILCPHLTNFHFVAECARDHQIQPRPGLLE